MADERDDGGKWVWAFILGVIVGILLMLGVGGALLTTRARQAAMEAERARMMEMMVREEAERAREAAERAEAEAKAMLKAAKEQQEDRKKEGKK
jgi:hypothetical protein